MTEDRLMQIEMLLAHHERKIEELSDMTTRQWEEIGRLHSQIERLQAYMQDIQDAGKDSKSETGLSTIEIAVLNKPTHY